MPTHRSQLSQAQLELLQKISAYQLDDPASSVPFSTRLAKEQRWNPLFAKRVCEEYKRFTFLAVVADHPVTPSKAVDEAWHLHLIYSQKYWNEFCANVLGIPLHHNPGSGEEHEGKKFHQQYANTIASYRRFFGEDPPRDIWPAPRMPSNLESAQGRADGVGDPFEVSEFDQHGARTREHSYFVPVASLAVIGIGLILAFGFSEARSIAYHLIEDPSPSAFLWFFGACSVVLLLLIRFAESGENVLFTWYLHALFGLLLCAGLFRLAVGATTGRPVGYLAGMVIGDLIGWLWVVDLFGGSGDGHGGCGGFFSCGGGSSCGGGCGGGGCGG